MIDKDINGSYKLLKNTLNSDGLQWDKIALALNNNSSISNVQVKRGSINIIYKKGFI